MAQSQPVVIPKKRMLRNARTDYSARYFAFPTGFTEYQDGISKLGGVILRHDIHVKNYLDSLPNKPCPSHVELKPKNWLANYLSRCDYKKLAEVQKRLHEELLDFNADMANVGNTWTKYSDQIRFSPYFKTEYMAAYGQYRPARWISGGVN